MNSGECPQCNKVLKDASSRLVQDNCGHKKCRLCLVADEFGCLQCSKSNQNNSLINLGHTITDKEGFQIEDNHTTVITCNKFYSTDKLIEEKNNSLKINDKIEKQTISKTGKTKREISHVQKQKTSRKYNSFTVPEHIEILKQNGQSYKCTICQKTFQTKYYVNAHKNCAKDNPSFKCDQCSKTFLTKSQLDGHLLVHSNVSPHICTTCNKSFKEKSKLKRHKLIHSSLPLFVCQKCGKEFKSKDNLKIHCYTHEEEKQFQCKTCNKKFSNSSNLKKHTLKHSKEKNHMCDQCGKRFKFKWSLTVHRKSHIRVRVHKCLECTKAFINAKELERHLLIHLGVKPYSCTLCEASFRRKDNLERHVKNTHPGKIIDIVTSVNVKELIKNKLNSSKVVINEEPIKEKPNAIKVITNSHFNKSTTVISNTVNAPLKLAFKTKAFKSHYNIHGREYVETTPKLQPRSYDAAESVSICKKILSPYSSVSTPSISKSPTSFNTNQESTEIYEKILSSAPIDSSQPRPYGIIKFKLPTNYKNMLNKSDQAFKSTLEPLQSSQEFAISNNVDKNPSIQQISVIRQVLS